jgi:hypothetical protein
LRCDIEQPLGAAQRIRLIGCAPREVDRADHGRAIP